MMYQGGKTKLAPAIAAEILSRKGDRSIYVEPFLGSAAVMSSVTGHFDRSIGADAMPDLIMLWQAVAEGWQPPELLTAEQYDELRNTEPSALRAFAGFPCSFGGKWFGGFARDPRSDRNYARTASRSILKRSVAMRSAEFMLTDYRCLPDALIGADSVIYADPPYAGTTGYAGSDAFDSEQFWRFAESWSDHGALVLVSEYAAPDGWECIWSTERHTSTALDNRGARAIDRLFVRGEL